MKTPFKLQRTAPSTFSTQDRTATRSLPIYSPLPQKQLNHPPAPIRSQPSPFFPPADTTNFEKRIGKLICEDSQLSERSWIALKGGHSYTMRGLQSRLALASPWGVPERVRVAYDAAVRDEGRCEFQQGALPGCCLYYFAIGRQVLFYDVGRAIQRGGPLEEYFTHECIFESTVFQVMEVGWRHPIFGEFKNKNILLIALPWKFRFAAAELQGGRLETGPRWMRLTLLTLTLATPSPTASHIVEDDEQLYFLDSHGGLSCVSIQPTDWLHKLLGNHNRHMLAQATKLSTISNKAFFVSRKASFLEKLYHYSKVVFAKVTNFYGKKVKRLDLVCDRRRKMLFSLVDTNPSLLDTGPSVFRMLTAWDISKGKPIQRAQISEAELYEKDISGLVNFGTTSNYRIVRLATVRPCQDGEVQLMAMLECGIRLYLKVDDTFRVAHFHLPPPIDHTLQKVCEPREHYRSVQLTHAWVQGPTTLINLREEGDNHSFLIWKQNQRSEQQECVAVTWGASMSSPSGNPPIENYIYRLSLSLEPSRKQQLLKSMSGSGRNPFTYDSALSQLHELARDLFLPPTPFIHSTDTDIQYFCMVRPIDRAFNAVAAGIRDQDVLSRVFEGLPNEEIQFLLLQLYCDDDGIYLKDLELIDCLTCYQRRVLQQGVENFEKFQKQFSERGNKVLAEKKQRLQSTYVGRESVTPQMEETILEVLVRVAGRGNDVGGRTKDEQETQQSICSSILLYLARALHFLWKNKLSDIKPKVQILVSMIQPLHKVLTYLRSPHSKTKVRPQKQVKLERLSFGRKVIDGDAETVVGVMNDPLQVMSRLISKITQLIQLCSKMDLRLKDTFEGALGMGSQLFEAPLFRFLIEKNNHPLTAFDLYKQAFPCFIGQGLQKSLRIEEECRNKEESQILLILKFHKNVSDYLLKYLQETGKVHADQIRTFKSATSIAAQKSLISANVKQGVLELLDRLKQPDTTLSERNTVLMRLNSLLTEHLRRHEEREDRFYREAKIQINEITRRLTLQELIIQQYESHGQPMAQVISELKTTLFEVNVLRDLVESIKTPKLTIIYCLLFEPIQESTTKERLQEGFKAILQQDLERHEAESKQGFFAKTNNLFRGCQQQTKSRWFQLQRGLKSIVASVHSSISFNVLIPQICSSLLCENSTSPVITIYSIRAALSQIQQFFTCRHKPTLRQKMDQLSFPIISILLWRAGSEQAELQTFYQGWLRSESERETGSIHISHEKEKEVLYQWINVLSLSLEVEMRGEFILQNSHKFIQIFLRMYPEESGLKMQLWRICQGFSLANGLEVMYKDIFK